MKGQVYKAKKRTILYMVLTPIIYIVLFYGVYYLAMSLERQPISDYYLNTMRFTSFLCATIGSFLSFYIANMILWDKLKRKMRQYKYDRLINHYNLCLKHMENKDYQKALQIYNKVFGNSNQPTAHIIRVALKVAHNQTLEDEYLNVWDVI